MMTMAGRAEKITPGRKTYGERSLLSVWLMSEINELKGSRRRRRNGLKESQ